MTIDWQGKQTTMHYELNHNFEMQMHVDEDECLVTFEQKLQELIVKKNDLCKRRRMVIEII